MERRIAAAWERLESARGELLRSADAIPLEQRSKPPLPGQWSLAQVVVHLAMAEEGALAYLRKKREHGGHGPNTLFGAWRLLVLRTALALPIRWRAPNFIAVIPEVGWNEAVARWQVAREDWRDTLASMPEELATHELFKHPVAGKLSLVQGLRFMARHVRHHEKQVRRIRRGLAQRR